MTAVNFDRVTVKRGKNHVLNELSLNLGAGRLIGLLGPSGAGKTTIMRAIVAVQSGVKGAVSVLDLPAGHPKLLTKVAYSTQQSSVFDDLSVRENLRFAARILGVGKEQADLALERVHLEAFAKQRAGSLSGGQRSRASLAMALVGDPQLLVLDEPTVGLDPVLRADLWQMFRELASQGKTLLISSHVMDEAERCDEIVFVREGKVIAHDTLPALLAATSTSSAEEAFLSLARRTDV
jgi:ABC-2 type transport system ATP-binding protein